MYLLLFAPLPSYIEMVSNCFDISLIKLNQSFKLPKLRTNSLLAHPWRKQSRDESKKNSKDLNHNTLTINFGSFQVPGWLLSRQCKLCSTITCQPGTVYQMNDPLFKSSKSGNSGKTHIVYALSRTIQSGYPVQGRHCPCKLDYLK